MAISLVQTTAGTWASGSPTSSTIQPGSNITTGNTLILVVGIDAGHTVSTITDSAGNTWTEAVEKTQTGMSAADISIWYAPITSGGGSRPTITITPSTGTAHGAIIREYSGLSSSPLDKTQSNSGTTGTTSQTSNATAATDQADELVVGAMQCRSGTSSYTVSAGSGYGNITSVSPNFIRVSAEDKIVSATGTQEATFTTSVNTTVYAAAVATFRASSNDYAITTSDSTTVSESRSMFTDQLHRAVNDSLTVTETVSIRLDQFFRSVSDSITVSESVSVSIETPGSLAAEVTTTDSTTVTDSTTSYSDTVFTRESYAVAIQAAGDSTLSISKSESITVTENTVADVPVSASLSDSVSVTDSPIVTTQEATARSISKSESVTLSESVQRLLESNITKQETVTVTESVNLFSPTLSVIIVESVTVTESAVVQQSSYFISVSDGVSVTENVPKPQYALRTGDGVESGVWIPGDITSGAPIVGGGTSSGTWSTGSISSATISAGDDTDSQVWIPGDQI